MNRPRATVFRDSDALFSGEHCDAFDEHRRAFALIFYWISIPILHQEEAHNEEICFTYRLFSLSPLRTGIRPFRD